MRAKIHAAKYSSDGKPDDINTFEELRVRYTHGRGSQTHVALCRRQISVLNLRVEGDPDITCPDCLGNAERVKNIEAANACVADTLPNAWSSTVRLVTFIGGRLDGFKYWLPESFLARAGILRTFEGGWQVVDCKCHTRHECDLLPTDYWLLQRGGTPEYTYELNTGTPLSSLKDAQ